MSLGWVTPSAESFFCRPALPFALQATLLAPLALGANIPGVVPLYGIAAPWLIVALVGLNLPVLAFLFHGVRLDLAARRNHALEHATIHFLERAGAPPLSGRADKGGFRVFGRVTAAEIRQAFDEVAVRVEGGMPIPYLSPRCGSNRLTALVLGTALLVGVTLGSVALHPPVVVSAIAFAAAVGSFYHWRDRVGHWAQDRFFMATDFETASVRNIRQVRGSNRGGRLLYDVRTRVV